MSNPQSIPMRRVFNRHHNDAPRGAIYVGRPSRFGNPYAIGHDGDRAEVIAKYRAYVLRNPKLLEDIKRRLKGKALICWCWPRACHADVLAELSE
jgi:hypothetical protein